MVPIEPWRNSTPFFGAVAFCTTKIDDFRASLVDFFDNIGDLFIKEEVIKLEEKILEVIDVASSKTQIMEG